MTFHAPITSDTQAAILTLMADGRERTAADIAVRLGINARAAGQVAGIMVKIGALTSDKIGDGRVFRGVAKADVPQTTPAPMACHASIAEYMDDGADYETAYGIAWRKMCRSERPAPEAAAVKPPDIGKHRQTRARALEVIAKAPGLTADQLAQRLGVNVRTLRPALTGIIRHKLARAEGNRTKRYFPVEAK